MAEGRYQPCFIISTMNPAYPRVDRRLPPIRAGLPSEACFSHYFVMNSSGGRPAAGRPAGARWSGFPNEAVLRFQTRTRHPRTIQLPESSSSTGLWLTLRCLSRRMKGAESIEFLTKQAISRRSGILLDADPQSSHRHRARTAAWLEEPKALAPVCGRPPFRETSPPREPVEVMPLLQPAVSTSRSPRDRRQPEITVQVHRGQGDAKDQAASLPELARKAHISEPQPGKVSELLDSYRQLPIQTCRLPPSTAYHTRRPAPINQSLI